MGTEALRQRSILVAAALRDREGHDAAVALLGRKAKAGVRVVSGLDGPDAGGVDWEAARAAEGGWEGAYAWAARAHDGICAVPVDGAVGLSRGVYSLAAAAIGLGRQVMLVRDGALRRVASVRVTNAREFRGVHGVAVLQEGGGA